jgi:hypothetical protein
MNKQIDFDQSLIGQEGITVIMYREEKEEITGREWVDKEFKKCGWIGLGDLEYAFNNGKAHIKELHNIK